MEPPFESSADAVTRLRDALNALRGIMALPALWTAGEPPSAVSGSLDALLGIAEAVEERLAHQTRDLAIAHEALRDSERNSRLVIDNIPGMVAILTATGDVEFVNHRILEYTGQTLEELRDWGTNGTVHPEDLPQVTHVFAASIGSGRPYDIVQRLRRHDGVYRWFQNNGFPLRRPDGRILRWCVLLTDVDERKRAEDALRESERHSRQIVDSIPGVLATFTPSGEVEFVNRPALDYFGKTFEELRHWESGGATHPDDLPRVVALFTQAIASGETPVGDSYVWECRTRRYDGVYRWFQSRLFPLRNTKGEVVRWYNLLIDIDERKRAEDALRSSEHDLKLITDTIPALVWSARPDGSAEFFNRLYLDFVGRSAEEMSGWGWTQSIHVDDLPDLAATWQRIMASGAAGEAEARLLRHDGEYRWFLLRANPLRDESGNIVRWYGVNTDIEDRRRAEDALRASERNLQLTIDTIPTLAWAARPDGSVEFLNEHYLTFLGLSAAEATNWNWAAAVHPDDMPALTAAWQRQVTSAVAGDAEARIRRHDGEYRWFLFRANPLRDDSGRIIRWYGVNTDIEDRKRAEQELRRSEAFLAQAQRLTLTGSLWWKVPTGEVTWSDESYRLMGYPRTTTPTVALILDRVHPDDLTLVRETVERSAREGVNMDFEHRLLMPDGTIKHVHVVVQSVREDAGASEFIGAISDITERKRAEAELRRAYDSFRDAQRLSHTGSFTADIVADEHVWSDELYRICEFDPGTKITTNWAREIIHPEDQPLFDAGFARSLQGADFDLTFRIVTRSGRMKHLHSIARVVDRAGGRPLFVGAIQDVTEAKNAEEALNRARSELAHVTRVTTLSTLTASIAHEVNQPLSGIITNAGTCLRMLDADPPNLDGARETARRTIRDGHRASEVMTRLRALFSKREFALESLNLNEAIQEVVALSRGECQRNRIMLQVDLADDLPTITGDRVQLQQVILNLLRNALDAMLDVHDRPRHLLIRTERNDDERVHVTVRDAGIGIDAHAMNRLFEPFYTTKSDGMGIGLSISRSIVERHHGRLWAEPNDGPGATFRLAIPCGADRAAIGTA